MVLSPERERERERQPERERDSQRERERQPERERETARERESLLVSWCFKPSQPQRIITGLNTNLTTTPS